MDKSKKAYEKAKDGDLMSGSLKFAKDYLSIYDVYVVACEWAEADERVKRAVVRDGGSASVAIDFLYDLSGLAKKGEVIHSNIKEFFIKKLGEGMLHGWDYAKQAVLIK